MEKNIKSSIRDEIIPLFGEMHDFDERQSKLYNEMIKKIGKTIAYAQF